MTCDTVAGLHVISASTLLLENQISRYCLITEINSFNVIISDVNRAVITIARAMKQTEKKIYPETCRR